MHFLYGMKLISLNTWDGKAFAPLMEFVKQHSESTDIFSLQEVLDSHLDVVESRGARINLLAEMTKALHAFDYYFEPEGYGLDETGPIALDIASGQAIFFKKSTIKPIREGAIFVYKNRHRLELYEKLEELGCNFQYFCFEAEGKKFTLLNLHGIPYPGDKLDNRDRLSQSKKILEFLARESCAKILCGDFNLMPETKSVKMIEDADMINLIKKFKIGCTRSRLSPFYGNGDFQKFADYMFVSPDVNILSFDVPDLEVSDHLPMVLEFS